MTADEFLAVAKHDAPIDQPPNPGLTGPGSKDADPVALAPTQPMGAGTAALTAAGSAVPLGDITGAAAESLPGVGNGHTFRENYDARMGRVAQAQTEHPVASALGTTAGGLATMAASGGMAPGAGAAPTAAKLTAGMGANVGAGAIQGGAAAAAEGKGAGEVGERALKGATTGAAVATGVAVVSKALGAVLNRAMARSDDKILSDVEVGATSNQARKITERADSVVDKIRNTPSLAATYKTPKQFLDALNSEVSSTGDQLDSILDTAETVGGKVHPDSAVKSLTASQGQLNSKLPTQEIGAEMQPHINKISARSVDMSELKPGQVKYLQNALATLQAGKTGLPPADVDAAVQRIHATLSGNGIGLKELRGEVTRLQTIAYDRSPTAPATPVREAAGRAAAVLKDVLESHIDATLPGEAETVRRLNADQTVLLRLQAAAQNRVGGKVRTGLGLTDALTTTVGAATAAAMHHGGASIPATLATGAIVAGAPRVARAVGSGLSEAAAIAGRAGAASPDGAAAQAGRLVNQLTRVGNKGGSVIPREGDKPTEPEPDDFSSKAKPIPFEEIHTAAEAGDTESVATSLFHSIFGR